MGVVDQLSLHNSKRLVVDSLEFFDTALRDELLDFPGDVVGLAEFEQSRTVQK